MISKPSKGIQLEEVNEYIKKNKLNPEVFFDNAYYDLERNNQITSAKGYQSMYFFLRNLLVLLLISFPCIIYYVFTQRSLKSLFTLGLAVLGLFILRNLALFYREKMCARLLKTYLYKINEMKKGEK